MKDTVVYGSALTGEYSIVANKKSQQVPFQGRHDCRITACTNETHTHTQINGCALTGDCRLLISVWNRHRPRPFPCGSVMQTQRICFHYGVQRGVWLWNTDFGNWKTSCSVRLFAERIEWQGFEREAVGRSVRGNRWKCWALRGDPKICCFSHSMRSFFLPQISLPQTYEYNTKTHQ